jgi:hypothetical protein
VAFTTMLMVAPTFPARFGDPLLLTGDQTTCIL